MVIREPCEVSISSGLAVPFDIAEVLRCGEYAWHLLTLPEYLSSGGLYALMSVEEINLDLL